MTWALRVGKLYVVDYSITKITNTAQPQQYAWDGIWGLWNVVSAEIVQAAAARSSSKVPITYT